MNITKALKSATFLISALFIYGTCSMAQAINPGLTLPSGFKASVVADKLGKARHIAFNSKGDLFVKLDRSKNGGIVMLKNNNGAFNAEPAFGSYSGTGIAIHNGYLYASSNKEVFRYKLNDQQKVADSQKPETIVTGLIDRGQHNSKSIALDNDGNLYVNIGAYSNSCQQKDRQKGSMGREGCPILDSAGGIWQFKADKLNQTYGDGTRYATGLRNVVGLDWNTQTNSLFVMQHGRDQLHDLFPDLYTEQQSAELPAECMYELKKGDNAGWPYMYYDQLQNKKIVAPEYGGDSKKEADGKFIDPVVAFPGHMAPNALLFYTGNAFPEKYKNGAFIAFHGSWNRSPQQEGYFVAFVPFKDGKPTGKWEVFAKGFAGTDKVVSTNEAQHRPCGLTQGPDGSLYVSDDVKGTIYKISYQK